MRVEGRSLTILLVLALITIPAAALRALCIGRSCDREAAGRQSVPYCSLPADVRGMVAAGYREGRSPDVLGVSHADVTVTQPLTGEVWPSVAVEQLPMGTVLFGGAGVTKRGPVSEAARFEDISPTIATIIDFEIPHPEVRSGRPIRGIASAGSPRLVLIVVLRGLDPHETDALAGLGDRGWVAARVGLDSFPFDRAALFTTIGTGGTPSQHGVTGAFVRNDRGDLVRAWSGNNERSFSTEARWPGTIIATLADDLDDVMGQRPQIALIGHDPLDRGLVGGDWYVNVDRDTYVFESDTRVAVTRARSLLLKSSLGDDAVPDLLAISLEGDSPDARDVVTELAQAGHRVTNGHAAIVAIGVPASTTTGGHELSVRDVVGQIEEATAAGVVEQAVPGGLFLDQQVLVKRGITKDQVVRALQRVVVDAQPAFADAFPGIAVSFARFC